MKETMFAFIQHYGYAAVFVSMMLGIIGLPIPLEVLLLFAGSIVAGAKLSLIWFVAFAWLGTIAGMGVNYALGRSIGLGPISKVTKYVHLNEERLNRWADKFQRSGPLLIAIGYFVGGLRHASPLLAGASGMSLKRFLAFAAGGGLLWITVFTLFGHQFGQHWHSIMKWLHHPLTIAAVIVIGVAVYCLKRKVFSSYSQVRSVK